MAPGIEAMISGEPAKPGPRHHGDAAVLTFPAAASGALTPMAAHDGAGKPLDATAWADTDLMKGVDLARSGRPHFRREGAKMLMSALAPGTMMGDMKPDGTLAWTPPKLPAGQQWRVLRLGNSLLGTSNHPAPPEATGREVDKFDGPAVRRYMEHYIGMNRDAAGAGMVGDHGVRAILTASIEVGAANWTPRMIAQFRRLRDYDPTPWLPTLTGTLLGTREQSVGTGSPAITTISAMLSTSPSRAMTCPAIRSTSRRLAARATVPRPDAICASLPI